MHGVHEAGIIVLHAKELVDREVVHAKLLGAGDQLQHVEKHRFGHLLVFIQLVVLIALDGHQGCLQPGKELVRGRRAGIVELGVVPGDPHGLQDAQGGQHLGLIHGDLDELSIEVIVEVEGFVRVPLVGAKRPAQHERDKQPEAKPFEEFFYSGESFCHEWLLFPRVSDGALGDLTPR